MQDMDENVALRRRIRRAKITAVLASAAAVGRASLQRGNVRRGIQMHVHERIRRGEVAMLHIEKEMFSPPADEVRLHRIGHDPRAQQQIGERVTREDGRDMNG